jgi:uncharacterized repeat protein (TIGR03803 family)
MKHILLSAIFYCVATAVSAQTFTVLHKFELTDGQEPLSTLVKDASGSLYGTTAFGGNSGSGVIFKVAPTVSSRWSETVLHNFTGGSDGANPWSGLIADETGEYGTASNGGSTANECDPYGGCGTIFSVNRKGNFSVVYSFLGGYDTPPDGQHPLSRLMRAATGNFFGTTESGGNPDLCLASSCGVAFEVDAGGTESVIYTFLGSAPFLGSTNDDGAFPEASLIEDKAGNLYGTTEAGGINNNSCSESGCGVVFELSPNGSGGWTESVIYRFTGELDGSSPQSSLILDSAGNLYGTAAFGGSTSCALGSPICGVVFKLTKESNGGWEQSVLHSFVGDDGAIPDAELVRDSAGNLYGTTANGGDMTCPYSYWGCGTVFKIDRSGKETVLHTFRGPDGVSPQAGLLLEESTHVLYGTATSGGDLTGANCNVPHYVAGCGVVFRITF